MQSDSIVKRIQRKMLSCDLNSGRHIWQIMALCWIIIVTTQVFSQDSTSAQDELTQKIINLHQRAEEGSGADLGQSLRFYQEALALARETGNNLAAAVTANFLGTMLEDAGENQQALYFYEQGLKILSASLEDSTQRFISDALNKLREKEKEYFSLKREPLGTDVYRGVIEDLRAFFGQPASLAERQAAVYLFMNAGNIYLQQYQFEPADLDYQAAESLARQFPSDLQNRKVITNLAWSAIKNNALSRADSLLKIALSSLPETQMVEMRRACLAQGIVLRDQDDFSRAIHQIDRAVSLYKTAQDTLGLPQALSHLAIAHLEAGNNHTALPLFREALELSKHLKDPQSAWQANAGMGECYHRLGDNEKSLKYYREYYSVIQTIRQSFYTDQGKVSFLENQVPHLKSYAAVLLRVYGRRGNYRPLRGILEEIRGGALETLHLYRQAAARRPAGALPLDYLTNPRQWRGLRDMEIALPDSSGDLRELKSAGGVIVLPENAVQRAANVPSAPVRSQTAAPISPPKVTFLEYFILSDSVVALLKTPQDSLYGVTLGVKKDSLAELTRAFASEMGVAEPRSFAINRNSLPAWREDVSPDANAEKLAKLSKKLYRCLVKPVLPFLPPAGSEIVLIPDSFLWGMPFAALQNEEGIYFCDRFLLSYAPAEGLYRLLAGRQRQFDPQTARAWIVGDPRMPDSLRACKQTMRWAALPGARAEAEAIGRLFAADRAKVFYGNTADRLRLEAWHPGFDILHFATHGFACPEDPLSSFIILSELRDGEITPDEPGKQIIVARDPRFPVKVLFSPDAARDTRQQFPRAFPGVLEARTVIQTFDLNADLVTLSACQTGLGKFLGQGPIGFTRAFLAAGARSLLVSLWNVNDQATREWMVAFYTAYLEHGNKARALQQAMQQTRVKYPEPKNWAAFTLVGLAE